MVGAQCAGGSHPLQKVEGEGCGRVAGGWRRPVAHPQCCPREDRGGLDIIMVKHSFDPRLSLTSISVKENENQLLGNKIKKTCKWEPGSSRLLGFELKLIPPSSLSAPNLPRVCASPVASGTPALLLAGVTSVVRSR